MDVSLFGGLSTGPSRGQLVCRNGEQTGHGHGGCVLAECLRAHLCLCGLGFQKQASAQDCPHCCDFHLQAFSVPSLTGKGQAQTLGRSGLGPWERWGRRFYHSGGPCGMLASLRDQAHQRALPMPREKPKGWLGSEWLPFLVSGGPFRAGAQPRCPRRED